MLNKTALLFTIRILILTFFIAASVYAQNYRIYFGDLHSHTTFSDGEGTPSEAFRQAAITEPISWQSPIIHSEATDCFLTVPEPLQIGTQPKIS